MYTCILEKRQKNQGQSHFEILILKKLKGHNPLKKILTST